MFILFTRWHTIYHKRTTTRRQNTSHQTHTTIHCKFTLTLNHLSLQSKTTDVVIQQQSQAPEDGYIDVW